MPTLRGCGHRYFGISNKKSGAFTLACDRFHLFNKAAAAKAAANPKKYRPNKTSPRKLIPINAMSGITSPMINA